MSRRQLVVGTTIILALLAYTGWAWWPRERPGRIEEGGRTASILLGGDLPYRLWVPYPHQNLGVLERFGRRSEAVAALADLPAPRLPSFGPLATPPARDLALATSTDGERLLLAARVYRPVAWLARAAGLLAGNPWLAGGAVGDGEGRTVIAWEGATWTVARGAALPAATLAHAPNELLLGALALERPAGPLPRGLYRLRRRDPLLELVSEGGETLGEPRFLAGAGVPLAVFRRTQRGGDLLALLTAPPDGDLPRWALVHDGRGRRPSLPGEKLYNLVGHEPLEAAAGGSRLAATDDEGLAVARRLAAALAADEETSASLEFAASGDLDAASTALGPLVEELSRLPLEETRRWSALLAAARSLGPWSRFSVVVAEGPGGPAAVRLGRAPSEADHD